MNGESIESDFYFSKWYNGIFDSKSTSKQGNAWGIIWQDGIVRYMNAYNVFWEKGTWRNGNWWGNPFSNYQLTNGSHFTYPGFDSDLMMNVALYASQSLVQTDLWKYLDYDKIFINNSFTFSSNTSNHD